MKKRFMKNSIYSYIQLHITIWVYSVTTILIKLASRYDLISKEYLVFFFFMIVVLGVYAILWQQVIKKFDPSVAYSNKSVTTVWTIIYAHFLFGESITVSKIVGALLIVLGVVIVSKSLDRG